MSLLNNYYYINHQRRTKLVKRLQHHSFNEVFQCYSCSVAVARRRSTFNSIVVFSPACFPNNKLVSTGSSVPRRVARCRGPSPRSRSISVVRRRRRTVAAVDLEEVGLGRPARRVLDQLVYCSTRRSYRTPAWRLTTQHTSHKLRFTCTH